MRRAGVLGCALALAAARASSAQVPEVPVTPVSEVVAVPAGGAFQVAVRLDVPPGWHIDWINPGTTGLPTTVAWTVPAGVASGPTRWPFPERLAAGGEVAHVLRGEVYVVTPFHVASDARPGSARLRADLTWLLCSTSCIRQQGTVSVPVRLVAAARAGGASAAPAAPSPAWAPVEAAAASFPALGEGITIHAAVVGDSVRLEIGGLRGAPPAGSLVTFFPALAGRAAVVTPIRRAADGVAVVVPVTFATGAANGRLTGVLVGLLVRGPTGASRAMTVDVPVAGRRPEAVRP